MQGFDASVQGKFLSLIQDSLNNAIDKWALQIVVSSLKLMIMAYQTEIKALLHQGRTFDMLFMLMGSSWLPNNVVWKEVSNKFAWIVHYACSNLSEILRERQLDWSMSLKITNYLTLYGTKLFIIQCIQNNSHLLLFSMYKIWREHAKYL